MKEQWEIIVAEVREELGKKHLARESGLQTCRKVIQTCSKAIRHIHRRQMEDARTLLDEAGELTRQAQTFLKPHPDLYYAGYLQDAEKEYVEGEAVFSLLNNKLLPTPTSLGVHPSAYLNGMAEAASECRRTVLDTLRRGDASRAEELLSVMEDIYDALITFDYPDALTSGLRRTCDSLRAVLERTRSDFSLTHTQKELQCSLEKAIETFNKSNL